MLLLLVACSENELVASDKDVSIDTGEAAVPNIVVTPSAVDFGVVAVGGEATAAVTISNLGEATLHVEALSLADGSVDLVWTSLSSPILPAGSSVETVLSWAPSGGGPLSDTLLVRSDDPDTPEVGVPLSGLVPYGEILVDPAFYDFGTLLVGEGASTVVTVSNVGDGPLTLSDWSYSATDADMRVVDAGALGVLPAVLDPGESTEVVVEYAPSTGDGDEGSLSIDSDDPDTPNTGAQQAGNGEDPDPCEGFTQTVNLFLTADDAWQGWLDGVEFTGPGQNAWNQFDSFEWEMECGDHTLSLYATDTGMVIAGVIAVIEVEGTVRFLSGPTDWTMIDSSPPSGWTDVGFDDSAWHIPEVCADGSPWGTTPQPFYDLGASWIWWSTDCRNLGEAWLRLNFSVP